MTIDTILNLARQQIGTRATNYKRCKYNTAFYGTEVSGSDYDWCCAFIWWIFKQNGADNLLNGKTANCGQFAKNFKNVGRLYSNKNVQVGDIVLFHWSNNKSTYVPEYYTCDHIGIVEAVNGDTITTIEGNTNTNSYPNGIVARQTRSVSRYVSCVCKPAYSGSPSPTPTTYPTVSYKVRTGGTWLPEVTDLSDYAGLENKQITDVAIKVSKGSVKYRVHIKGGSWLPYVTGYNTADDENGYAGDKKPIDLIEVYYSTPNDVVSKLGYLKAKYRVSPIGSSSYYDWQYDDEKTGGQDGYAGDYGMTIDKFQIELSK